MTADNPVADLQAAARAFGRGAARRKLRLLGAIEGRPRLRVADRTRLYDTLGFLRAYPDDPTVLAAVRRACAALRESAPDPEPASLAGTGLPGTTVSYSYSYGVLRRLVRAFPDCLEIDWEEVEDETALLNTLGLVVTMGETQALDDMGISTQEWLESCRPAGSPSALAFILDLLDRSRFSLLEQAHLYDGCELPIRYRLSRPGTARCELALEPARIQFQREEIDRRRPAPAPRIRRPLGSVRRLGARAGDSVITLGCAALACRSLEITPLMYGNRDDVHVADCGRGVAIVLVGVLPEYRDAIESTFAFLLLKNGVPLGYGPASACLGRCEMGINLFPEFRGAEIRHICSQLMRVLRQVLDVEYFLLTRYAMGEGNEEALRSGAFWFYRRLGFVPTNPEVEALAREEEERMRQDPSHRSDLRTLRRLSDTEALFDLGRGPREPLDLGRLGVAESRLAADSFGGDRETMARRCADRVARALGIRDRGRWSAGERRALRTLAPLLSTIPDLANRSRCDKTALIRAIRAKGARTETHFDRILKYVRHMFSVSH